MPSGGGRGGGIITEIKLLWQKQFTRNFQVYFSVSNSSAPVESCPYSDTLSLPERDGTGAGESTPASLHRRESDRSYFVESEIKKEKEKKRNFPGYPANGSNLFLPVEPQYVPETNESGAIISGPRNTEFAFRHCINLTERRRRLNILPP